MTVLHAMRRLRHTLGQGLVAVFSVAWLGLLAHNCAMAGERFVPAAPADSAGMEHGMAHGGHHMPAMDTATHAMGTHAMGDDGAAHGKGCCCCDEPAGAPHCATPACGVSALTLQSSEVPLSVEPVKLVLLPLAQAPPPAWPKRAVTPVARYHLDYLPLHPTLRFCTLLI